MDKVHFEYELDVNAFQGKDLPALSTGIIPRTDNKTGGLDGGAWLYSLPIAIHQLYEGKMSVPTVAPVPNANNTTEPEDADKGHAINEMSHTQIPHSEHNSKIRITIEEGSNNQASPITKTAN